MAVTQKLACVVERVVSHGERVYTLELRPERPVPRFRAGQFLHHDRERQVVEAGPPVFGGN